MSYGPGQIEAVESSGGGEKLEVGPVTDILQRQDVIYKCSVRMDVDAHRGDVESIENSAVSVETLGVLVIKYADSNSVTEGIADGTRVVVQERGESEDESDEHLAYQANDRVNSVILKDMDSEQPLRSILVMGKVSFVSTNIDCLELKYVVYK